MILYVPPVFMSVVKSVARRNGPLATAYKFLFMYGVFILVPTFNVIFELINSRDL